jgi:hypothetical protein
MTTPWLWFYGPSGVGKSAIGYEVFSRLVSGGCRVGYVEIDQIGMCMPATAHSRSAAKADNLLGVLSNFGRTGVDGVVVSGDIAGPAMEDVLRRAPERPVLCRLRADHDVVVERLTLRGSPQFAEASRTYDEDNVVPPGDLSLTTHPLGVADLATEILSQLGTWPPTRPQNRNASGDAASEVLDCSAILVSGPRAVGKSTVAWELYMSSVSAGVCTGYLDLEQLAFVEPALASSSLPVKLANVGACWEGFRRQGAQRLVLCGSVDTARDLTLYRQLIPSLRVVALTAGYDAILHRARRRTRRKEIWLPGDDLFGRAESELSSIAERSAAFAGEGADVVLLTDAVSPTEVASRITYWRQGG